MYVSDMFTVHTYLTTVERTLRSTVVLSLIHI